MKKLFLSFAAALVLLPSCNMLDEKLAEQQICLVSDISCVEPAAASFTAGEPVREDLTLTANRSWTARIEPQSDWVKFISDSSSLNLGGVSRTYPITLEFLEHTDAQARLAKLVFSVEGQELSLPVEQYAFTPVLEVVGPASFENLDGDGCSLDIPVRSNTAWTAVVGSGSTVKLTLGQDSFDRSDTLRVAVALNRDVDNDKTGTVVLQAEGCADVVLNFTQVKNTPRFRIDTDQTVPFVLPIAYSHTIYLDTNVPWAASLQEGTSDGITLSAGSGTVEENSVTVKFPAPQVTEKRVAVINFTTDYGLSDSITLVQEGSLLINFRKYKDNNGWTYNNNSVLTYTDPSTAQVKKIPRGWTDDPSWGSGTFLFQSADGYKFNVFTGEGEDGDIWQNTSGLVLGNFSNPSFYVDLPAIEGKRICRVRVMLGNSVEKLKNVESSATGTTLRVTDLEDNVIPGGELQQKKSYTFTEQEWTDFVITSFETDYLGHYEESMFDFVLPDTQAGESYRISGAFRTVMRWWIINYE